MPDDDGTQAELLRRFQATIAGAELADLRTFAGDLGRLAIPMPSPPERPELRRPPLKRVMLFRIRADLDTSAPPIWRRLDVRSDLTLDIVHQVLQVAFSWTDSHLHRFSLGGGPFDPHSQLFLCPWDAEEGEFDDDGPAASDVRLDEVMQEAGDVLQYIYDYGDSWELTLRLEAVTPAQTESRSAVVVDGRRAAPPEDCGGYTDAENLAEVLEDPAVLDLDELNEALGSPFFVLREFGIEPRLGDLVNRLRYTRVGEDVSARAVSLITARTDLDEPDLTAALRAHRWFLDRASAGPIPLTAAGYLKPSDVVEASKVVPAMADWIGEKNREAQAFPLLEFRSTLVSMGLLRKRAACS